MFSVVLTLLGCSAIIRFDPSKNHVPRNFMINNPLNKSEANHFQLLALAKHGRSKAERKAAEAKVHENRVSQPAHLPSELEEIFFDRISGWENYAVLELFETSINFLSTKH